MGVHTATGNYTQESTDLSFAEPLAGLLDWARTYNSRAEEEGWLGVGWTTTFEVRLEDRPENAVALHDADGRVLLFARDARGRFQRPQDLDADLTEADDGSRTLRYNSGLLLRFTDSGRLVRVEYDGRGVDLTYGEDGRPVRLAHSLQRELQLSWNGGRLTNVRAGDGRSVTYSYDEAGRLTEVTGPATDATTRLGTDEAGRLTEVTDPDGVALVTNTYDEHGRVVRQTQPTGGAREFAYDEATGTTKVTAAPSDAQTVHRANADGRLVSVTDEAGHTATFGYDDRGHLTQGVTPEGTHLAQVWDERDRVVSSELAGHQTRFAHDDQDRTTSVTGPDGGVTSYAYTGNGRVPTTLTEPGGARTRRRFSEGLLTEEVDADGRGVRYGRNRHGDVVEVTDAAEHTTRFAHDDAGNETESTLPDGATTAWEYDAAGRVTAHTDAEGARTTYTYSPAGRLYRQTDPLGAARVHTYDAAGNPASTTEPMGHTTEFAYDEEGNLTQVTDPEGGVTRYTHDALGRVTASIDPEGGTVEYGYDADGRLVEERTPSGTTRTEYDGRGLPTTVVGAAGGRTRQSWDPAGRLTSVTDPEGGTWRIEYDDAGMPSTVSDPNGARTRNRWSRAGHLESASDGDGNRLHLRRDRRGQVHEVVDPEGGVTRYAYDARGRRISVTSPAGLLTRVRYESAGSAETSDNAVATTDPRGWVTTRTFDARGQETSETTPSGLTTRNRYDAAGNLTAVVGGEGNETHYGYDRAGRLVSVTDANGHATRYTYDRAGRLRTETDPLGRTTTRTYDASGNLRTLTDPDGHAQHFRYDAEDRCIERRADDGTAVRFTYDKAGRCTSMTDGDGTTRYDRDAAGRVVRVTGPDGAVFTVGHDRTGRRTSLGYPDGLRLSYRYNLNGRLVAFGESGAAGETAGAGAGVDAVYGLDPDGRLLTERLPERHSRQYTWQDGLLTGFAELREGLPEHRSSFTHDPDGRLIGQRDDGHYRTFRYDRLGQLVDVRHFAQRRWPWAPSDGPEHEGHEEHHDDWAHLPAQQDGFWHELPGARLKLRYDAVGNRVLRSDGGDVTHYRYDEADQLTHREAHGQRTHYHYDSAGRLTEVHHGHHRRTLTYDGFSRPVRSEETGSYPAERIEARYNGDGLLTLLVLANVDERHETERTASVRYRWGWDGVPQLLTQRADPVLADTERGHPNPYDADFGHGRGLTFAYHDGRRETFTRNADGSPVRTPRTAAWVAAREYDTFGRPIHRNEGHGPHGPHDPHDHRGEHPHAGDEHGPGHATAAESAGRPPHRLPSPALPRFGFHGELTAGSSVFLRARWYATTLGRFTVPDPVTVQDVGPDNADHPYTYAANDPVNNDDPLGLLVAPGAAAGVTPAVAAAASPRARAQSLVAGAVLQAKSGQGGDKTTLHDLARDIARDQLAKQLRRRYGSRVSKNLHPVPPNGKEFQLDGASKNNTGKFGKVDLLYQHDDKRAFIWEVKSGITKEAAAKRDATDQVQHYIKYYQKQIKRSAAPGEPMERVRRVPYEPAGKDYHYIYSPHFNTDGALVYVKKRPHKPRERYPDPVRLPKPLSQPEEEPRPRPRPPEPAPQPPSVDWGEVAIGVGAVAAVAVVGALTFGTGWAVGGALLTGGLFAAS